MKRRAARLFLLLPVASLAAGLLVSLGVAAADGTQVVPVLPATGTVDPIMASYLEDAIGRAAANGSPAIVIKLDTPGGALDSMQRIVTAELESRVPVIVWVAPAGGFAASAGTFITEASNLAYMAPGTRIGAASPVDSSGADIPGTEGQKVKNDAIALMRSIAETRGRNVDWAVSTVDVAKSSPASEAVSVGAVNGIAATLEDVRSAATGKTVTVQGGQSVTLDLSGATFQEQAQNPFQSFLHLLADPNIAFLLFTGGFFALLFELQNPNFVTGILGAIALLLAFIGFGSLPLNLAGLLFIVLGLILLALEPTVTSHGLLTIGGIVCFAFGASALYSAPGNPLAPDVSVALPLLVVMTITTAAFMTLIAVTAVRSRRLGPTPGTVGTGIPVGSVGEVRRPLAPFGSVYVAGEEWSARALNDEVIERGIAVRIVGMEGLTILVEPLPEAAMSAAGPGSARASVTSSDPSAQPTH
jgi:membrane-bound serine protease (ClpP class)